MKLLRFPDLPQSEFEAPTYHEAMEKARERFGPEAPLRCWKIRRGGVLGFFSREMFIAGIEPPGGIDIRSFGREGEFEFGKSEELISEAEDNETTFQFDADRSSTLSDLVDSRQDELRLTSQFIPRNAFQDILAEAEAAINRGSVSSELYQKQKPRKETRKVTLDLYEKMVKLGLPKQFLSKGSPDSLDALLASLATLPKAPKISRTPGSVIVVTGNRHDVRETSNLLCKNLGLQAADIISSEPNEHLAQKVARRKRSKKVTIVTVEVPVGSKGIAEDTVLIAKLKPNLVIGSVSATSKKGDVMAWSENLGGVDALAVYGVHSTSTPGDILGGIPVAYVDGMVATPINLLALLLGFLAEDYS